MTPWVDTKYLHSDRSDSRFNASKRSSKLDLYADKLSAMLRIEASKSRKQKRTIGQLHADLVGLGYEGSYNRVAAYARDWKAARQREQQSSSRGTFVPLAFVPVEAFQFDWSEDWALIVDDRYSYNRGSLLITGQVPIASWHEIIRNPTLGDVILSPVDLTACRACRTKIKTEQALALMNAL